MTDTPIADSIEADATTPEAPVFDVTHLLNLPADPPESERSVYTGPGLDIDPETGIWNVALAPVQPAPTVAVTEAAVNAAPVVSLDASGTPHVTIPLTKKTKGYVGTAISVATSAALVVVPFLPADSQLAGWIAVGVGIVGNAAVWLGITLPTNLPVNTKSILGKAK